MRYWSVLDTADVVMPAAVGDAFFNTSASSAADLNVPGEPGGGGGGAAGGAGV
jgi:hypothetical protein